MSFNVEIAPLKHYLENQISFSAICMYVPFSTLAKNSSVAFTFYICKKSKGIVFQLVKWVYLERFTECSDAHSAITLISGSSDFALHCEYYFISEHYSMG